MNMLKRAFAALCLALGLVALPAMAQQSQYTYSVDFTAVNNDQVTVSLTTPKVNQETIEFQIPKIVPGTYSISDFGRFLSNFKAMDAEGNALPVEKINTNRWQISNAQGLAKIMYTVDDTYDTELDNVIFEPAGTSLEEDVIVLNPFGFFGYLKGMKDMPFEVNITRPANFYGATALPFVKTTGNTDTYRAANYFDLADAPMLFNEPDTVSIEVGGAQVLISVYSPGNTLTAKEVLTDVEAILRAQEKYMGGQLPIDKYAFLIYLFQGPSLSGGYGALEHSYSSMYNLPEGNAEQLGQTIRDVAAHEFFHIITPLNIHSEEIGDFDFIDPKMSEHLWLYEGMTEYQAGHVQIKYELYDLEAFLGDIRSKINGAANYREDISFTEMSKGCLDEYENQYSNVYLKGALIGMCMDIMLRDLSNGEYGIQNLLRELGQKYGKDKSFKDSELFAEIEAMTYPEIGTFLREHVGGTKPLPIEELLGKAGIEFSESQTVRRPSLGIINTNLSLGKEQRIVVANTNGFKEFATNLGLQEGDTIITWGGLPFDLPNIQNTVESFRENTKEGKKVKVVVRRKDKKGKVVNKTLKAKAIYEENELANVLEPAENPTAAQLALRKAWLVPNE